LGLEKIVGGIAPWPRDASKLARNLNRRPVMQELFSAAKSNATNISKQKFC
jgi:hypothetical protein